MHKFLTRLTASAIGAIGVWTVSICSSSLSARATTFTKILDLGAAVPGHPGETFVNYQGIGTDGTTIVFYGVGRPLGIDGIYTIPITGGPITKIAEPGDSAPGGGGIFIRFVPAGWSFPSINNGKVVFWAELSTPGAAGIYSAAATGGPITRVANHTTPIPGGSIPGCTGTTLDVNYLQQWTSLNSDKIAFSSRNCNTEGIYTALLDGARKRRIANGATPINYPSSASPTRSFGWPSISGSNVVYVGSSSWSLSTTPTGIFLGSVSNNLPKKRLIDNDTPYPDGSGRTIGGYSTPLLWNNSLVFSAWRKNSSGPDLNGLFLTSLSQGPTVPPRLIANANTTVPGYGGTFTEFPAYAISGVAPGGPRIVFYGTSPSIPLANNGLFQYRKGALKKIVASGETVAAQKICNVNGLSAQALSANKLVFSTVSSFGCSGGGIFTADLAP
ncbi:MAG: hypothetical protein WCD18_02840 [Thermosynechococcaceae cyanobacterium]